MNGSNEQFKIPTTIEPWLILNDGKQAIEFYQAAFDAKEVYRMEDPEGGIVAKMEVKGAGFWLSSDIPKLESSIHVVKMILTVSDPDALFNKAIDAGAKVIFPIGEAYGWSWDDWKIRLDSIGRLAVH